MEIKSINPDLVTARGAWNDSAIKAFLEEHAEPQKAIELSITDFYSEFYTGSKQIKYMSYYCRKHLLDCMKELNIAGTAVAVKEDLRIRFD